MDWRLDLNKRFWIEERFAKGTFEQNLYNAILKTMRYIGSYIRFGMASKKDLPEIREFYLTLIQ